MFTVTQEMLDEISILHMSGRFEFSGRKIFTDAVKEVQVHSVNHVILNFQHVSFLDSAALGLLALVYQNLKLTNIRLSIANPQEYVKSVLDQANFPKFIPLFSSIEEATRQQAALA